MNEATERQRHRADAGSYIVVVSDFDLMQWQYIVRRAGLNNLADHIQKQRAGRTNWRDLAAYCKGRARRESAPQRHDTKG